MAESVFNPMGGVGFVKVAGQEPIATVVVDSKVLSDALITGFTFSGAADFQLEKTMDGSFFFTAFGDKITALQFTIMGVIRSCPSTEQFSGGWAVYQKYSAGRAIGIPPTCWISVGASGDQVFEGVISGAEVRGNDEAAETGTVEIVCIVTGRFK